jgi:nucleotide-binding universal stress UspA family protein
MFKRLLVPLDGTPQSASALPFARVLAGTSGGRLVLMQVVEPWKLSPEERIERPRLVLGHLERIAEELHASGLEVAVRVSTGEVVPEVLSVADVEHADALVIATHPSRLERLVDNSTTGALIARSALPVFVIRPGGRRIEHLRNLLVAVDGTLGGARALDQATRLARLTGAALVLVRVTQPHGTFGFDPLLHVTLGVQSQPKADAEALAAAEEYVNDVSRRLRDHGIAATPRVMVGQPAERIVAAAEQVDADVIIMSTHGYQAPLRSVLGSTADEVVRSAGRPVLLVRRTDGEVATALEAASVAADCRAVFADVLAERFAASAKSSIPGMN